MKTNQRVSKSHEIAKFNLAKTTQTDSKGRARVVEVPGSEGKRYQVIIRRGKGFIEGECRLETGAGLIDCQGNRSGVCYHVITAISHASRERGFIASITGNFINAERIARMTHQPVIEIRSRQQSKRKLYATFKEAK